jgi:threonylcarbamoyladenosine tRNA methylthiotransferase MtaB
MVTNPKKARVQVLGCKVNQAEAAAMAGVLERKGYVVDPAAQDPDLVLVNTCCVTAKAEGKSRRMVHRLAEQFPSATLIVTGCLAQVNPSSVKNFSDRVITLGTSDKDRLSSYLDDHHADGRDVVTREASFCTSFGDMGCPAIPGRGRTFLKIQDGCSQGCAYCIVPTARGPSRSLPVQRLYDYAAQLAEQGLAELVLTGIHLGWYGRDLNPALRLEDVLDGLAERCPATRFRLSSIEPQEITQRLIELVATRRHLCRHFHIPLQSGDDAILQKMGRPYDVGIIRDLAQRIFRWIPDACVGLDIMVGFPGEDEESFRRTERLIEDLGVAYLHVFPFSPRPGTTADLLEERLPDREKRVRVNRLRTLSGVLRRNFYQRFLGKQLIVVPESVPDAGTGRVRARTDNYIPVRVQASAQLPVDRMFLVTLTGIVGEEVEAIAESPGFLSSGT